MHRRFVTGVVACLVAAAAAGCGSAPAAPKPGPATRIQTQTQPPSKTQPSAAAAKLTDVTLRLPWLASGYDAPFVAANAQGFYKKAGFNVRIAQGKGSAITGQVVGNGSNAFGVDDAGTAALLISKGVPIKLVSTYVQKSPMAFIYDRSHPFNSPRDLVGRLVVTSAGNATLTVLPAVLAAAGVKPSQVKITTVQPQSFATELKTHPDAVVLGVSLSDYLTMHKLDPNAAYKLYADFGPNVYSFGLITNLNEMKHHPGAVKRFVAASNEGWAYARKHPRQTVKDLVATFPNADATLALQGLQMSFGMLHTPNTSGHPLGWMASKDWQQALAILKKYGDMPAVRPLGDYYTNQFIPAS